VLTFATMARRFSATASYAATQGARLFARTCIVFNVVQSDVFFLFH
jgi:hypothetical protein